MDLSSGSTKEYFHQEAFMVREKSSTKKQRELFRYYCSIGGNSPMMLSETEAWMWDASKPDHRDHLSSDGLYLAQLDVLVCSVGSLCRLLPQLKGLFRNTSNTNQRGAINSLSCSVKSYFYLPVSTGPVISNEACPEPRWGTRLPSGAP